MGRMSRCSLFALAVTVIALTGGCASSADPSAAAEDAIVAAETEAKPFCEAAAANIEAAKPLAALNASGPAPHPADAIATAIEPLHESNQTMLDSAPPEVRPDAELAYQLAEMQLALYEASGGDPAAVSTDATYVAKVQEADGALKRMQSYLRDRCRSGAG